MTTKDNAKRTTASGSNNTDKADTSDKRSIKNPREVLTNLVISAIQDEKTLPWRKPWQTPYQNERANNPITGTIYKGGNSLLLTVEGMVKGHTMNRWVTRKQAEGKKWEIKEEAEPVAVEVWDTVPFWKTERGKQELSVANQDFKLTDIRRVNFKDSTFVLKNKQEVPLDDVQFLVTINQESLKSENAAAVMNELNGKIISYKKARDHRRWNVPFAACYLVYNLSEIDGVPEKFMPKKRDIIEVDHSHEEHNPYVMAMLRGMQDDGLGFSEEGVRAFYRPSTDSVTMPELKLFERIGEYDATLSHEMGHATLAAHRLNREHADYAREELVAELTSMFIHHEFGVDMMGLESPMDNHINYLDSWSKTLKDPKNVNVMYQAASDASKAVDYLAKVAAKVEPELMVDHTAGGGRTQATEKKAKKSRPSA